MDGRSIEVTVDGRSLCCMRSMDDLVARVRQRVVRAAEAFVKDNPGEPLPAVSLTLEAPSLMFALATNACALCLDSTFSPCGMFTPLCASAALVNL